MNNTGGSAFPTTKPLDSWGDPNQGMTLRDYFAGQALAAVNLGIGVSNEYYRKAANHCYAMADAMLKEREA